MGTTESELYNVSQNNALNQTNNATGAENVNLTEDGKSFEARNTFAKNNFEKILKFDPKGVKGMAHPDAHAIWLKAKILSSTNDKYLKDFNTILQYLLQTERSATNKVFYDARQREEKLLLYKQNLIANRSVEIIHRLLYLRGDKYDINNKDQVEKIINVFPLVYDASKETTNSANNENGRIASGSALDKEAPKQETTTDAQAGIVETKSADASKKKMPKFVKPLSIGFLIISTIYGIARLVKHLRTEK
jgi:hypothetical protein